MSLMLSFAVLLPFAFDLLVLSLYLFVFLFHPLRHKNRSGKVRWRAQDHHSGGLHIGDGKGYSGSHQPSPRAELWQDVQVSVVPHERPNHASRARSSLPSYRPSSIFWSFFFRAKRPFVLFFSWFENAFVRCAYMASVSRSALGFVFSSPRGLRCVYMNQSGARSGARASSRCAHITL